MSDSLRPHGLQPTGLLSPWNFPGKSTPVGCHFLLQETVPTQGLNPRLLGLFYWQQHSFPLSHRGSPLNMKTGESGFHVVRWTCSLTGPQDAAGRGPPRGHCSPLGTSTTKCSVTGFFLFTNETTCCLRFLRRKWFFLWADQSSDRLPLEVRVGRR